jgi:hypothetical protein
MSTPTLPDAQTAYANLFAGVRQRVVFNKLAAAGYAPRSEAQAQYMMMLTDDLAAGEAAALQKSAADGTDPYYQALSALREKMAEAGLTGGAAGHASEVEMAIKQAAHDLAQDPELYNSVLALRAQEAAQLQAQR